MRPGNAQFFDYDNGQWVHSENIAYTYYPSGLLQEAIVTEEGTGTNSDRWTYAYDAEGNEIEWKRERWNGTAWVGYSGVKIINTMQGDLVTESVEQMWNGSVNDWVTEERTVYTYTSAGALQEEVQYGPGNVAERKLLYQYAAANQPPSTIVLQLMENESWVDFARIVDIGWNDAAAQDGLADYTLQVASGNDWVNAERQKTTFSGNGSFVEITEEFTNGAWVNAYKATMQYDTHENLILEQYEEWENGAWIIDNAIKFVKTYDNNGNLTESYSQRWELNEGSTTEGTFINRERYVYSNFQNVLSAKEEFQKLVLDVYPNPAQGQLSVKMEKGAGASVKLVSLTGQTLLQTSLSTAGAQDINLSAVPAGTYILQIQSKAGVRTQKIVKL